MTPLLVLDSNVYISAVLFGGKPRQLIEAALAGKIRLAVSTFILEEIEGVLRGKKFKFPAVAAREVVSEIASLAEIFEPTEKISRIKADPADDRILECNPAACLEKYKLG